jgi:predicted glycosyltransferase
LPLLWIALRLPYHILKEHFILKRLIKRLKIDIVISDNRFGLWNNDIKTILITHQLKVIFPKLFRVFEPVGAWVIRLMAEKFDSCWIPDYPDSNGLAGELSHLKKLPSNARYIGILSRFQKMESSPISTSWELVGIVSGPSPQREIFIDKMEKLSQKHNIKTLIVKGIPSEGVDIVEKDGIWYAGHLNDMEFAEVIKSSKYLICRAGYSSIMDMASLGIKCILVPTPGQTEQEYLAKHLSNNGLFNTYKQIELENINISSSQTIQNSPTNSSELLEKIIVEVACSV